MDATGSETLEMRFKKLTAAVHADMQTWKSKIEGLEGQTNHNIQVLSQTIQELRTRVAVLEVQPPVPVSTIPKLPPFRFGGDRDKFRGFLNQCRLFFAAHATQFPTDRTKVLTIIMLLTNKALAWANPLIESQDACLDDFDMFVTAMSQMFDDPNRCLTAETALLNLRQGKRPVTEYAMDFRRWAQDTTWNSAAKYSIFKKGLSGSIKDELARAEAPTALGDFINHCVRLDARISERRLERWAELNRSSKPFLPFPPKEIQDPRPQESAPEPMQVNSLRNRATDERKEFRLKENLCFYCGKSGHFIINCPSRSRRTTAAVVERDFSDSRSMISEPGPPGITAALPDYDFSDMNSVTSETVLPINAVILSSAVSQPYTKKRDSHCYLPIKVWVDSHWVNSSAMVDSGASGNFMDTAFAKEHGIQSQKRASSILMETVDGSPLTSGPVDQQTEPLKIRMGDDHQEKLPFLLISSPHFPIILGLPWLQAQNPIIDWQTKKLRFPVREVTSGDVSSPSSDDPPSDLKLPTVYEEFSDVCDKKNADKLPPHRPYDCPIELLPAAAIPFGNIYPLSGPELKTLKEYIDENLAKGFIRPSSSPAGAPIFFVKKKDGSLRPCVDYRDINKVTIKNRYPLPLIPELLERVRQAKIFTKLDLRGAYNLVRIRPGDEWKTAFRSRYGHFEYLVMPFGLCNAPATFQHLVNDIFRDILDLFVVIYLDDILIFSSSMKEHQQHVKTVLQRLREYHLYIKLEKCEFHKTEIQFLGYVISPGGLSMDNSKIKAIQEWPIPKNVKEVQRFIGFANFYRRFIKNFSEIVSPITRLTQKKTAFIWSSQAQEAFSRLKTKFTTAPVLIHPDPELAFIIEVDASNCAIGAILSQRTGEKSLLHPCAFFSQRLSPAEKNYDVGNKELLAIIAAFKEWRHLLQGASQPIIVLTDHRNLEFVRSARCLTPRQARWSLFLNQFNFTISYRPGSRNGKADALSRMYSTDAAPDAPPKTILPNCNFVGVIHNQDLC